MTIQKMLGEAKKLAREDAARGYGRPDAGVLWTVAKRCRRSGFHYLDENAILAAYASTNERELAS